MAFKDITVNRLRDFRKNMKVLLDDLDEFLKAPDKSVYDEYFSSSRKVEKSLDERIKYPSLFYSFKCLDKLIEVRKFGKSSSYVVYCLSVDFLDEDIKQILQLYNCDIDISFSVTKFVCCDFRTAVECWQFVIKLFFNDVYYKQMELF